MRKGNKVTQFLVKIDPTLLSNIIKMTSLMLSMLYTSLLFEKIFHGGIMLSSVYTSDGQMYLSYSQGESMILCLCVVSFFWLFFIMIEGILWILIKALKPLPLQQQVCIDNIVVVLVRDILRVIIPVGTIALASIFTQNINFGTWQIAILSGASTSIYSIGRFIKSWRIERRSCGACGHTSGHPSVVPSSAYINAKKDLCSTCRDNEGMQN